MQSVPESDLGSVLMCFSRAIRIMNRPKVPPPRVFNTSHYYGVEDFLIIFEKYASSVYGDDQLSWVQVLPDFLEGEHLALVESFGMGANLKYKTVRDALVEAIHFKMLGEGDFENFMNY